MGILRKIADEYFGNRRREEDKNDFDRYFETINWVDMGHPKYLFSDKDFKRDLKRTEYGKDDYMSPEEMLYVKERYVSGAYDFMDRRTMKRLLEKNDFHFIIKTYEKPDYTNVNRMVVEKQGSDDTVEINTFGELNHWVSMYYDIDSLKRTTLFSLFNGGDVEKTMTNLGSRSNEIKNSYVPPGNLCMHFKLLKIK